ncbi:MAG: dTMP kinase [Actinobacteria bacterium]|nr:dTMP kinase [Actinomycetota bacterium]
MPLEPPEDASLDDSVLAGLGSGYKGLLITFEGLDGCGKSTQMELLAAGLQERGYVVLVTREPGGTALGEAIRDLLLDPRHHGMSVRAEALLYAAARAHLAQEVIRPALEDGQVVLCDRYLDSSLAYQGYGRGLGNDDIITLNAWATECLFPDLTILLDLDDELRSGRLAAVPDRLEAEDEGFHRRVAEGYRQLLTLHPHRIRRVDAQGTEAEVQKRVRTVIEEELELFSH